MIVLCFFSINILKRKKENLRDQSQTSSIASNVIQGQTLRRPWIIRVGSFSSPSWLEQCLKISRMDDDDDDDDDVIHEGNESTVNLTDYLQKRTGKNDFRDPLASTHSKPSCDQRLFSLSRLFTRLVDVHVILYKYI
jgi:hypothetical protein